MRYALPFLLCLLSAFSLQAQPGFQTIPLAGTVVLADVKDPFNAQVNNLENPAPDAGTDKARLLAIKQKMAALFPHRREETAAKTTAAQLPVVSAQFIADSNSGIPPDNDMAVSSSETLVHVMNSNIAVRSGAGSPMTSRKTLKSYSAPVGLSSIDDYRYDPKIMWDPEANRFISVMLNSTNQLNWIVIGFSQTADPAGGWNFYKLYGDYAQDTTWFDYPTVALTKHEFFLSGNKLGFNTSWQTGFRKSIIYQIRKSDGYAGLPLGVRTWDDVKYNGRFIRNLYPVKSGFGLTGPEQYFLSNRNFDVQNDTVFLIRINDTAGAASPISVQPLIASLSYGVPPDGRQPDPNYPLATNDGRILGAFRHGNEIQFTSATMYTPNGNSGVYHGRIANFATSPSLQAAIIQVDSLDFGYPNLSYSGDNQGKTTAIINFNYSGPTTYPGVGAVFFDGTEYSPLLRIKSGDTTIRRLGIGQQRWGDYTGSQPLHTSLGTVWIAGIFGSKAYGYGSWLARLNNPLPTAIGSIPAPGTRGMMSVYPNPATAYMTAAFTLPSRDAVSFAIYDMTGRKVAGVLDAVCKKGRNEISLNIASLAPGQYVLRATTADGATVMSQQFSRR